jgi:hypothetical protein
LTLDYSINGLKDALGGLMTTIGRRVLSALLGLAVPIGLTLSRGKASRRPAGGAVQHIGATENFGRELRALRSIDVSPELVSDIEVELRWGLIWHDFERSMQAEVDRIFAPVLALTECEDFDELRDLVGLPDTRELVPA